jgi:uncharacterized protein YwqG
MPMNRIVLGRTIGLLLLLVAILYLQSRANFHPLDQSLQLARRVGLTESVVSKAQRLAQPGLQLEHSDEARFSWLGGVPAVASGFEWPAWKGQPLGFVAQIDLEEVAAAFEQSWLPKHGQLYFFYTSDQSVGGYEQTDLGAWRVIYATADRTALVPAAAPSGLDEEASFPQTYIRLRRIDTVPTEERFMGSWETSNEEFDALFRARAAPFREQPHHQMFGFPDPEQDDAMEAEAQRTSNLGGGAEQWRLLLQIDTDDALRMMWQDGGLLYFWIREEDAAHGDFSKVWLFLQSG